MALYEEESLESLEKQEIALKLITHILDKLQIDSKLLEQVRFIAKKQLHSLCAFMKIRKRDWNEQGPLLKARINANLSVYQSVARLKIKSLASLDPNGETSKRLVLDALALLLEAAEACLLSVCRKLRVCEEPFSSLLLGIAQIPVIRGGQLLRVLLICFKPLVLTACVQPQGDTRGSSQGALFERIKKTSCETIESGWTKDRVPVDTFIMVDKEKHMVPPLQLNLIHLLADVTVTVNKSEVVDLILPLFVESLEEGDASTPSSL